MKTDNLDVGVERAGTCEMNRHVQDVQTRARCADKHVLGVQMNLVFVHHNLFFHRGKALHSF